MSITTPNNENSIITSINVRSVPILKSNELIDYIFSQDNLLQLKYNIINSPIPLTFPLTIFSHFDDYDNVNYERLIFINRKIPVELLQMHYNFYLPVETSNNDRNIKLNITNSDKTCINGCPLQKTIYFSDGIIHLTKKSFFN